MSEENLEAALSSAKLSRRALVKAGGWMIPAVMVIGMPRNALAQSGSDSQPSSGGGNGGNGGNGSNDRHHRRRGRRG